MSDGVGNFRCQLCGRQRTWGHVVSSCREVGPVCTMGLYSCLLFQIGRHHRTPTQIFANALIGIAPTHRVLSDNLITLTIGAFIFPLWGVHANHLPPYEPSAEDSTSSTSATHGDSAPSDGEGNAELNPIWDDNVRVEWTDDQIRALRKQFFVMMSR